ncbi:MULTISPECIES: AAA family ATPase [unclassified Paenibacillus]|uniref:AAA family ATPase n=1 Tax=unclassified Paenibacillus TaxID=185978 RepID=UPI002404DB7F|nr:MULTISPECIES: AAA family ATPase [unclassified Paenibacillus]MDF9840821.1 putative kinase [Paenibacillus sp. PastF-2]MDF9847404.1 putative kinase [Paenibacillus sp. PastM-2]MDF9854018.1 putative kinase [Paenibacillus sp. PastF-1]MDH6479291.1 putative kinase [Paenibacillus sp. PastH-2]MDH6506974.1 putative kinase [Paenibacillus sp. PastM-3]
MNKVLILLAGLPGTGKTYLGNMLNEYFGAFCMLSQDSLKELLADEYGFNNLEEKREIERMAWAVYYETMERQMLAGSNILSDYPFSQKQKPRIQQLAECYGYKVLTIRLIAELDVLYERQKKRDMDPERHLSHIVTSYNKGKELYDRSTAEHLLTREAFISRCTTRGYDTFELGKLLEVDVTDYSAVDYPKLLEEIRQWDESGSST